MTTLEAPLRLPDNPETLTTHATLLQEARQTNPTIHSMSPAAIGVLALYGEYTTTHQRYPERFGRFHQHMKTVRALGQLATNVRATMEQVEGFEDAGEQLGTRLAATFAPITAIHAEDIDFADPTLVRGGAIADAAATAKKVTLAMPDRLSALNLARVLQALLRTDKIGRVLTAVPTIDEQKEQHIVEVHGGLNEYDVRVLGSAITKLIDEEDTRRQPPSALPPYKRTLSRWKHEGETFAPVIDERLAKVAKDYTNLMPNLTATYTGRNYLRPRIYHEPLGTEPAAAFEGLRKLFNGLIHYYRGGSHHNQEQNPNKQNRLLIERGVDLKRDSADPNQEWLGPSNPRTLTFIERVKALAHQTFEEARTDWLHASLKVAAKLAGAGISSILEIGVHFVPDIRSAGKWIFSDYFEWGRQKKRALADSKRIDTVIASLQAHHARLQQEHE